MCALDGKVKMLLIPHVFRQEVYAGLNVQDSPYYDGNEQVEADKSDIVNTSPVNFFAKDVEEWPRMRQTKILSANLNRGDCIFIPAYYFYQYSAHRFTGSSVEEDMQFESQGGKSVTTIVSLKYETNSHLLDMFMS